MPLAILAVLLLALWWTDDRERRAPGVTTPVAEIRTANREPSDPGAPPPNAPEAPAPGSAATAPPPARVQQAYRFVLSGDQVALEAAEEVRGDFHQRRGGMDWMPGMFYFRLLDSASRVLAEQTIPAPDHQCIVLDPHVVDENGKPKPAAFTPQGPVVFQVRMPKVQGAARMRVYRLSGTRRVLMSEEPPGQLLASIPLVP